MIYQIDDKYYINISPSIYVEVKVGIVNDNVVLTPTTNKIEITNNTNIIAINIHSQEMKDRLKPKPVKKQVEETTTTRTTRERKYSKRY